VVKNNKGGKVKVVDTVVETGGKESKDGRDSKVGKESTEGRDIKGGKDSDESRDTKSDKES